MNKRLVDLLLALILGLGFPAVLFSAIPKENSDKLDGTIALLPTQTATDATQTTQPEEGRSIQVLMNDGKMQKLEMDLYLVGVVLKEMPADFSLEALKAQAVVARTYALRRELNGDKHTGASVCADPTCCQGYCAVEEYLNNGGLQSDVDKITKAVKATTGQVLLYDGQLIEATYFSCSGGMTENALAVWGADVPYLQSTQSPGEEGATHYVDTVYFAMDSFSDRLGISLSDNWEEWIESISYTQGGGVNEICICGKTFTGTQIRKLLDLRSTAFNLTVVGNIITITTKGYGHRVGMSQYGADAMAVQGKTYKEILAHYYKGTELATY